MWDPPPTDVDFSLLIRPGGKVVTNFETLGIKLSEATTINTNRLLRELTYKFKGEVHAMGTDQRFFEYSAAGSGRVQIKERAGQ